MKNFISEDDIEQAILAKLEEKRYMKSTLHVGFNDPLNELDSEDSTYGRRANNPDICKYNYVDGVCAFVCEDYICRKPSKAWKKQYQKLSDGDAK